jgi:hypothetical protein
MRRSGGGIAGDLRGGAEILYWIVVIIVIIIVGFWLISALSKALP